MFRQWSLNARLGVLAAAGLLLIVSAAPAQENGGYFKYLESRGWYNTRSYYRQPFVAPRLKGNPSPPLDQRVRIHLQVPTDARIWFDNQESAQTGSFRDFITPPLSTGREYKYAVRVEWTENGCKVQSIRRLTIHAGDRVDLDLTMPTLAQEIPGE